MPTARWKNSPWLTAQIAMHQGSTIASISGTPQAGRSRRHQPTRRSTSASASGVPNAGISITGPFSISPTPSAAQYAAATAGGVRALVSRSCHARSRAACSARIAASRQLSMVARRPSAVISTDTASSSAPSSPACRSNSATPIRAVSITEAITASSVGTRYAQTSRSPSVPLAATAAASSQ